MKPNIFYFAPVVILYLFATTTTTTAQLVAGCEQSLNCTECLRSSESCQFLRCGRMSSYYCGNKTETPVCQNSDVISDIQFCSSADTLNDEKTNETIAIPSITGSPIPAAIASAPNTSATTTTVGTSSEKHTTPTTATTTTTTTITASITPERPTTTTIKEPLSSVPSMPPTSIFTPMGHSTTTNRRFDGPSFIGGIVLTFGLLAVAYVGFKFYRARIERNYHTLQESSIHI